ncbi:uncharacterized protein DEA37_0004876 [Paragonimus westermani]|uniref:HSA domain-containing protein n=1 Tax=Paragonimus westermani TaxID=34504 RepID=A0A5J4NXP4_9TREM|nr:uncharacterized protein DEA37_0004876 [Paragonimus westermani]
MWNTESSCSPPPKKYRAESDCVVEELSKICSVQKEQRRLDLINKELDSLDDSDVFFRAQVQPDLKKPTCTNGFGNGVLSVVPPLATLFPNQRTSERHCLYLAPPDNVCSTSVQQSKTEGPTEQPIQLHLIRPEIAQDARLEATVLQQVTELRRRGMWSAARLPKVMEPKPEKTLFGCLLKEVSWMSADFREERKWKIQMAYNLAVAARNYLLVRQEWNRQCQLVEELVRQRNAAYVAAMIRDWWKQVQKSLKCLEDRVHRQHLRYIRNQNKFLLANFSDLCPSWMIEHYATSPYVDCEPGATRIGSDGFTDDGDWLPDSLSVESDGSDSHSRSTSSSRAASFVDDSDTSVFGITELRSGDGDTAPHIYEPCSSYQSIREPEPNAQHINTAVQTVQEKSETGGIGRKQTVNNSEKFKPESDHTGTSTPHCIDRAELDALVLDSATPLEEILQSRRQLDKRTTCLLPESWRRAFVSNGLDETKDVTQFQTVASNPELEELIADSQRPLEELLPEGYASLGDVSQDNSTNSSILTSEQYPADCTPDSPTSCHKSTVGDNLQTTDSVQSYTLSDSPGTSVNEVSLVDNDESANYGDETITGPITLGRHAEDEMGLTIPPWGDYTTNLSQRTHPAELRWAAVRLLPLLKSVHLNTDNSGLEALTTVCSPAFRVPSLSSCSIGCVVAWLRHAFARGVPGLLISPSAISGDAELTIAAHLGHLIVPGARCVEPSDVFPVSKPLLQGETGDWGPHLIVAPRLCIPAWRARLSNWCPGLRITCLGLGCRGAKFPSYEPAGTGRRLRSAVTRGTVNIHHILPCSDVSQTLSEGVTGGDSVTKNIHLDHPNGQLTRREVSKSGSITASNGIDTLISELKYSGHRLLISSSPDLLSSACGYRLFELSRLLLSRDAANTDECKSWTTELFDTIIDSGWSNPNQHVNNGRPSKKKLIKFLEPFVLRLDEDYEWEASISEEIVPCHMTAVQRQLHDAAMSTKTARNASKTGDLLGLLSTVSLTSRICNHPCLSETRPQHSAAFADVMSDLASRIVPKPGPFAFTVAHNEAPFCASGILYSTPESVLSAVRRLRDSELSEITLQGFNLLDSLREPFHIRERVAVLAPTKKQLERVIIPTSIKRPHPKPPPVINCDTPNGDMDYDSVYPPDCLNGQNTPFSHSMKANCRLANGLPESTVHLDFSTITVRGKRPRVMSELPNSIPQPPTKRHRPDGLGPVDDFTCDRKVVPVLANGVPFLGPEVLATLEKMLLEKQGALFGKFQGLHHLLEGLLGPHSSCRPRCIFLLAHRSAFLDLLQAYLDVSPWSSYSRFRLPSDYNILGAESGQLIDRINDWPRGSHGPLLVLVHSRSPTACLTGLRAGPNTVVIVCDADWRSDSIDTLRALCDCVFCLFSSLHSWSLNGLVDHPKLDNADLSRTTLPVYRLVSYDDCVRPGLCPSVEACIARGVACRLLPGAVFQAHSITSSDRQSLTVARVQPNVVNELLSCQLPAENRTSSFRVDPLWTLKREAPSCSSASSVTSSFSCPVGGESRHEKNGDLADECFSTFQEREPLCEQLLNRAFELFEDPVDTQAWCCAIAEQTAIALTVFNDFCVDECESSFSDDDSDHFHVQPADVFLNGELCGYNFTPDRSGLQQQLGYSETACWEVAHQEACRYLDSLNAWSAESPAMFYSDVNIDRRSSFTDLSAHDTLLNNWTTENPLCCLCDIPIWNPLLDEHSQNERSPLPPAKAVFSLSDDDGPDLRWTSAQLAPSEPRSSDILPGDADCSDWGYESEPMSEHELPPVTHLPVVSASSASSVTASSVSNGQSLRADDTTHSTTDNEPSGHSRVTIASTNVGARSSLTGPYLKRRRLAGSTLHTPRKSMSAALDTRIPVTEDDGHSSPVAVLRRWLLFSNPLIFKGNQSTSFRYNGGTGVVVPCSLGGANNLVGLMANTSGTMVPGGHLHIGKPPEWLPQEEAALYQSICKLQDTSFDAAATGNSHSVLSPNFHLAEFFINNFFPTRCYRGASQCLLMHAKMSAVASTATAAMASNACNLLQTTGIIPMDDASVVASPRSCKPLSRFTFVYSFGYLLAMSVPATPHGPTSRKVKNKLKSAAASNLGLGASTGSLTSRNDGLPMGEINADASSAVSKYRTYLAYQEHNINPDTLITPAMVIKNKEEREARMLAEAVSSISQSCPANSIVCNSVTPVTSSTYQSSGTGQHHTQLNIHTQDGMHHPSVLLSLPLDCTASASGIVATTSLPLNLTGSNLSFTHAGQRGTSFVTIVSSNPTMLRRSATFTSVNLNNQFLDSSLSARLSSLQPNQTQTAMVGLSGSTINTQVGKGPIPTGYFLQQRPQLLTTNQPISTRGIFTTLASISSSASLPVAGGFGSSTTPLPQILRPRSTLRGSVIQPNFVRNLTPTNVSNFPINPVGARLSPGTGTFLHSRVTLTVPPNSSTLSNTVGSRSGTSTGLRTQPSNIYQQVRSVGQIAGNVQNVTYSGQLAVGELRPFNPLQGPQTSQFTPPVGVSSPLNTMAGSSRFESASNRHSESDPFVQSRFRPQPAP